MDGDSGDACGDGHGLPLRWCGAVGRAGSVRPRGRARAGSGRRSDPSRPPDPVGTEAAAVLAVMAEGASAATVDGVPVPAGVDPGHEREFEGEQQVRVRDRAYRVGQVDLEHGVLLAGLGQANSAAHVAGPTTPSATRPWARWNPRTAESVIGPQAPSAGI